MSDFLEVRAIKVEAGNKIYCEGEASAFKIEENLRNIGCETTIGCNEANMWSVYVNKAPDNSK